VVRSAPGSGDRELLDELAVRGREDIGASRLESWRGAGLLAPTVVVRHNGRGSSSALAAPVRAVADHTEAVAARTWRGRPYSTSAVAVTADGWTVDEELLRAGHAAHIQQVLGMLHGFLGKALAAWTGPAPRTRLDQAEALASWMVDQPSPILRRWKRNLTRAADVVAGSSVERVLQSGLSAAMRLILSGDGSDGGLYEFVTAQGVREFVLAITAGEADPVLSVDEASERVGTLMRDSAIGGRALARLGDAFEVPGEQLRAASVVVVALWEVLAAVPGLSSALKYCPKPNGDNPVMHSLAVAMVLRNTAVAGIDVEPLVDAALTLGLIDDPGAAAMRAAGTTLAVLAPKRLRPRA
jgi:hypothetical protein